MSLLPLFFTNVLATTVLILQILFRWIESMSKGKKHSIRQAARGVLLAIVSTGLLSGCMTMMLDDSTQGIHPLQKNGALMRSEGYLLLRIQMVRRDGSLLAEALITCCIREGMKL